GGRATAGARARARETWRLRVPRFGTGRICGSRRRHVAGLRNGVTPREAVPDGGGFRRRAVRDPEVGELPFQTLATLRRQRRAPRGFRLPPLADEGREPGAPVPRQRRSGGSGQGGGGAAFRSVPSGPLSRGRR